MEHGPLVSSDEYLQTSVRGGTNHKPATGCWAPKAHRCTRASKAISSGLNWQRTVHHTLMRMELHSHRPAECTSWAMPTVKSAYSGHMSPYYKLKKGKKVTEIERVEKWKKVLGQGAINWSEIEKKMVDQRTQSVNIGEAFHCWRALRDLMPTLLDIC